jgi:hypothetical protein
MIGFFCFFLYSTWSLTNTVFECISPLSFTFLFPFFPIFLVTHQIRKNGFSHKFHISVAPTDNRHKNQLTTTSQCTTTASCYHWHHRYCSFLDSGLFPFFCQLRCCNVAAAVDYFTVANIQHCSCSVCWCRIHRRQQELGGANAIHKKAPPAK